VTWRRQWLKILIGVGVSLGLLAYLLSTVDLRQVGHHVLRTRWDYLSITVGLTILGAWLRARRWQYLFPPDSAPSHLFSAVVIGYMANNILPLRAGELVRGYIASRHGRQGFWANIATLVVERVLDALAVVVILAWLVLAIPVPDELKWAALVFLSLDLAALAVLAFLALAPTACRAVIAALLRHWPRFHRNALMVLDTFVTGLQGIRSPAHLLPILGWSVGLWGAYAVTVWSALAATELLLPLTAGWAIIAFVGLGMSLPSAPGFIGVVQAAIVLALALFGVPRAEALSFSLVFHATQFVPFTLLGWILLLVEQVSLFDLTREPAPGAERRSA
jgi:hypothetical protein